MAPPRPTRTAAEIAAQAGSVKDLIGRLSRNTLSEVFDRHASGDDIWNALTRDASENKYDLDKQAAFVASGMIQALKESSLYDRTEVRKLRGSAGQPGLITQNDAKDILWDQDKMNEIRRSYLDRKVDWWVTEVEKSPPPPERVESERIRMAP